MEEHLFAGGSHELWIQHILGNNMEVQFRNHPGGVCWQGGADSVLHFEIGELLRWNFEHVWSVHRQHQSVERQDADHRFNDGVG